MASLLPDYPWRISYSSDSDNPLIDFYLPALERSIQYDRKSGFFNSAILSHIAGGLGVMLHRAGKIRLILGCQLNAQDVAAIKKGYDLRDAILTRLDADLTPPQNFAQLHHFEILSWLIAGDRLDIRIAIPLHPNGDPQLLAETLDFNHIFHEKVCLFTDAEGNQLATNGSGNESVSGWQHNIESFQVNCSWEGGRELERVQDEVIRFEKLWTNQLPRVKSFAMPDAIREKLLRYTPQQRPQWSLEQEQDDRPLPGITVPPPTPSPPLIDPEIDPEAVKFEQEMLDRWQRLPTDPGCLSYCLESIPVTPWPHQLKILRRVAETFPCSFLIADEVGLGKTIETGLILRYLLVSQKAKRILILTPASVQPQWHSEMREKFNLHFWSYNKGQLTDPLGETCQPLANPWNTQNLILASSHLVRRQARMEELLGAEPWDVVVLDEAHHARRKSPQQRKDTPNRLLQLLRQLKDRTQSLILLSATPMQIDPIEVFDLLSVLGISGRWGDGDNFCEYFATLGNAPHENLLKFWQLMTRDYFQNDGELCPRFQKRLQDGAPRSGSLRDRLLAARVEEFWHSPFPVINVHSYLQDREFLDLSRQFLSLHTPLKEKMFRHTRETLREYYRRGLLDRDIPRRHVYDQAIALEPTREADLYRQVSDYVRDFYRLAQQEERKALGFLMTLYRKRLTSSFYAIRASLQRRLEALLTQQGNGLTDDDYVELEDQEDAVIDGLNRFFEPVHPQEIEYLEDLLRQFENTGEDTKFSHLLTTLRTEFQYRDSVIIFTQYTDTLDFLRDELRQIYGTAIACYSGRGGEKWQDDHWHNVPKEMIKREFRQGDIKILLCTESASEGLNLQTCGVLINYDMPWNPMRVEQRIGRIDRIGQAFSTVTIHNFYYDGTVEAKVYQRLRQRIENFSSVVGGLQPILAKIPTLIEQATMSADPQEEEVLFAEFDHDLADPPLKVTLESMLQMDVEADIASLRQPQPPSPITQANMEQWLTTSPSLHQAQIQWQKISEDTWQLHHPDHPTPHTVTFYPQRFEENPDLQLMAIGNRIFEAIVSTVVAEQTTTQQSETKSPLGSG